MVKIKVVGIGGAGGNTISRMKKRKVEGVELISINTDYQDLIKAKADIKLRIGKNTTQGLGTGMRPELGEMAAKENIQEIRQVLKGADLVFITYGAGGGTGSGAGPVVAKVSKNLGILTIAVVTKPFSFEGQTRIRIAQEGIERLKANVDSLISISNDKLLEILEPETPINSAFWFCDQILREAVEGISNLLIQPGIIKINFADLKSILKNSGTCLFGFAKAAGEKRAERVVKLAIHSPLLDFSPKGAKGILFNVSGQNLSLSEVEEIGKTLLKELNPQAKIIFGTVQEKNLKKDEIKLSIIATGF